MWLRIVQERQVGEHLDGPVGDVAREERVFEGAVLELEQDAAFLRLFGLHMGYPRDTRFQSFHDLRKYARMFFVKILDDEREVLSFPGQMLRMAGLLLRPSPADMEIGYVPAFDQIAQGDDGGEAFDLSQPLDGQQIGGFQRLLIAFELGFVFHVHCFVRHGITVSFREIQEMPWSAVTEPAVFQDFTFDDRLSVRFTDCHEIRRQGASRSDAVFHLDFDGAVRVAASYLAEAPASAKFGQGDPDVRIHRIPQEPEDREQRGFAGSVRADEDGKARDLPDLHVFEGAKISYPDPLDPHRPIPRLRCSWGE